MEDVSHNSLSRRRFFSKSTLLGTSLLVGVPSLVNASFSNLSMAVNDTEAVNQTRSNRPKCKITVLRREYYQDLADQYLSNPNAGKCNRFYDGQEIIVDNSNYFRMLQGEFCSEAWDCISRYVYAALQGGSIMRGWTNDEKMMIACCNDGVRPVIFKLERIDPE